MVHILFLIIKSTAQATVMSVTFMKVFIDIILSLTTQSYHLQWFIGYCYKTVSHGHCFIAFYFKNHFHFYSIFSSFLMCIVTFYTQRINAWIDTECLHAYFQQTLRTFGYFSPKWNYHKVIASVQHPYPNGFSTVTKQSPMTNTVNCVYYSLHYNEFYYSKPTTFLTWPSAIFIFFQTMKTRCRLQYQTTISLSATSFKLP